MHCKDGCSALRERLQCTASEMGKRDTEIVSPIQDKRKGRKDLPLGVHYSLLLYISARPISDGHLKVQKRI